MARSPPPSTGFANRYPVTTSTSLDINDALGVQNIQSLTSAFDTIADFGRVMLAQGVDAATVSTELQKQVAVLVQLATSLGFDQQGVEDMAASLGLSGEALGAFVEAAATAAAGLAAIAAQVAQIDLFNQSFGSQATGPGLGGALNTAISGVTNAGQQFLTDWETQINTVFQISDGPDEADRVAEGDLGRNRRRSGVRFRSNHRARGREPAVDHWRVRCDRQDGRGYARRWS